MRYLLKELNIIIISNLLKILWLCPLRKKTVLFISYGGTQFSDSPKCVYDYLKEKSKGFELEWAFRSPEKMTNISELNWVKIPSFKYFYVFCTSKYIITNDFFNTFLPVRKSQILINTWHGGGWFKKVGLTDNGTTSYDRFFFRFQCSKHRYFVASSEYFVDTVLRSSFNYHGKILRTGMPRNAIFFNNNKDHREKIRKNFTSNQEALLVLYAPTYRNYEIPMDLEINLNRLKNSIESKFKKDVVILFRAHHAIEKFPIDYSSIIDVTSYPDMQQLLLGCDLLVSDYSSCMWDAAIQKKPVIVYAPDAQKYIDNRGFFLDIHEWPFILAFNNNELENVIANYDEKSYLKVLNNKIEESRSYESANAVNAIADIILNGQYK